MHKHSKLVFWCNSKRLFQINRAHCVKGTYILYPRHEFLHLRRRQGLPIRFYHFWFWYCYSSIIPDPSFLFLWSSSMCFLVFKTCSFSGRGHSKDLLSMFSISGQSTWPNYFHRVFLISTFVSAIPVLEPLCCILVCNLIPNICLRRLFSNPVCFLSLYLFSKFQHHIEALLLYVQYSVHLYRCYSRYFSWFPDVVNFFKMLMLLFQSWCQFLLWYLNSC